ncbi:HIT family protein [Shewanella sp. C32]|uniref:HIT family protein n=1 Tax=Shewanella electrica TaxID=515560 RepID=A0ABT2FJW0_9GAMM|nr:HIT family protein [Shewanella electrica]MCH1924937.1 HIT family protein [Shewanella electrica]MCS4556618.1 HIT family protein [Shewanella electrica]
MDLNYDTNNIFARIIRGELPAIKVYEDEHTLAFMDIMPQMPGHLLVLPKVPAVTLYQLPDDAASGVLATIKKVGKALEQAMGVDGSSVFQHNGSYAGQTVPHLHFHLVPGPLKALKAHASEPADASELQTIAARIRSFIV